MYNGFIATNTRLKKSKTVESSNTAGAPKVPSGGLKSREELKSLGERHGWAASELSMRQINSMSADETLWHGIFNKENFERAFERDAIAKHNRDAMSVWDTRRKWRDGVTKEETEKARIAGDQFATRFPQFDRTLANAQAMVTYMENHDLDATKIESYITAFRELTAEGRLTLAEVQSATDFYNEHKELHPTQISPLIAARNQREQNTVAHFAKSASATNEGSVTRVVDYGQEKHGVPPEGEKYSFKMKVRAMSADELAQRCADDPTFKAALDALD